MQLSYKYTAAAAAAAAEPQEGQTNIWFEHHPSSYEFFKNTVLVPDDWKAIA